MAQATCLWFVGDSPQHHQSISERRVFTGRDSSLLLYWEGIPGNCCVLQFYCQTEYGLDQRDWSGSAWIRQTSLGRLPNVERGCCMQLSRWALGKTEIKWRDSSIARLNPKHRSITKQMEWASHSWRHGAEHFDVQCLMLTFVTLLAPCFCI